MWKTYPQRMWKTHQNMFFVNAREKIYILAIYTSLKYVENVENLSTENVEN